MTASGPSLGGVEASYRTVAMSALRRVVYVERRLQGSPGGFSCALQVARDHGARLTVAAVVGNGTGEGREWPGASGAAPAAVIGLWERRLERLARQGRERGVEVDVQGLPGGGFATAAAEADLVITVGHREGLRWPFRFARTERELTRRCACPVWILHPAQSSAPGVVLACVDVGEQGEEAVSRAVVRSAAMLAVGAGAELHVAHVWSLRWESLLASRTRGGSRRGVQRMLARTVRVRRARIESLLEAEAIELAPTRRVHLRKGRAVPGLEAVAWDRQADLVVVGASDRPGPAARLRPGVAEQLFGRVPGSVLAVPAPGQDVPTPLQAGPAPDHRPRSYPRADRRRDPA